MSTNNIWSPRNIYLYTVCLISLVIAIFATVNLVRAFAELLYPEPEPSVYTAPLPVRAPGAAESEMAEVDEEQLEEQRETQRRWAIRRSVLNLVGSVTMLLVAGPLWIYHWRKIETNTAPGATSSQP